MRLTAMPEHLRPREKLLLEGASALTDAELLAIFLRVGIKGQNAIELAHYLLTEFGSLRQLLAANQTEFCAVKGLGQAKFVQLQAVLEMARRHLKETLSVKPLMNDVSTVRDFVCSQLRDQPHEVFSALFLDNQHHLVAFESIFQGTVNESSVYPRTLIQRALHHNAAAVILAHNHPSGCAEPSLADRRITTVIEQACAMFDIRVLDHLIVGDPQVLSFAEHGFMANS